MHYRAINLTCVCEIALISSRATKTTQSYIINCFNCRDLIYTNFMLDCDDIYLWSGSVWFDLVAKTALYSIGVLISDTEGLHM